jgi:hypothetical protein
MSTTSNLTGSTPILASVCHCPTGSRMKSPLLETQDEWVVHGFSFANYLAELGDNAQTEIFAKSSLDRAMRDAFRKMRHFLMATKGAHRG